MRRSAGDDKTNVKEEGAIGDELAGGLMLVRGQRVVYTCNGRAGVAGGTYDVSWMG